MRTRIAIAVVCCASSLGFAGEKPKWLSGLYPDPLPEGVEVTHRSTVLRGFSKVTNRTGKTLVYQGASADSPRQYVQFLEKGEWSSPSTTWCATGLAYFELRDGESIEFCAPLTGMTGKRRLVLFSVKDSTAGGLVAISPFPPNPANPRNEDSE